MVFFVSKNSSSPTLFTASQELNKVINPKNNFADDPQSDPQDNFAYDNEIETPIPPIKNMLNSAEQRRQQDDLYKNYIKEEGQRRQEQFEKEEE